MCAAYFLVCDGGVVSNWWNFSRNLVIYRFTALFFVFSIHVNHQIKSARQVGKVAQAGVPSSAGPSLVVYTMWFQSNVLRNNTQCVVAQV